MRTTVLCKNRETADRIYDLLVDPLSGHGCLLGEKVCLHEHDMIPDAMEFDLTAQEIDTLKKIPGVISVNVDDTTYGLDYTQISRRAVPRIASYTTSFSTGTSSASAVNYALDLCQSINLEYTHINNSVIKNLDTIDCSNVDILIMDSGIQPTHPEFNNNVVLFDWTQLTDTAENQIVSTQPANYYQDTDGHGTAVASLVAGNRSGFARNAKIYMLRDNGLGNTADGFGNVAGESISLCLLLALAFVRAKKLNLYGLVSTRPTIFVNSWGFTGPKIAWDISVGDTDNTINFSYCFDYGNNDNVLNQYNNLPGFSILADSYFRSIVQEGCHIVISAGNNNTYLQNYPVLGVLVNYFTKEGANYVTPRIAGDDSVFIVGDTYNGYTYNSNSTRYVTYNSPNIGANYIKDNYPVIIVGDVIPIGSNEEDEPDSNIYWSAGNAKTAYNILSATNIADFFVQKNTSRYNTSAGPFYVKSTYSNFGPDVDIYAPGNGVWAAIPTSLYSGATIPKYNHPVYGSFQFFNGTSASCPIVGGILATYLQENSTATPAQAKDWLLKSAITGNIMETFKNEMLVNNTSNDITDTALSLPFGSTADLWQTNPVFRLHRSASVPEYFNTANLYDLLFCNRFFDSNNLIAQAYPLRKAVLPNPNASTVISGTTLDNSNVTTELKQTHFSFT